MEIWDIYDENGNKTNRTMNRGDRCKEGDYFLEVDIWIRNSKGEYLISKRTPEKKPYPDAWEPTCGCAISGDDSISAALREVREELGVKLNPENGKLIKRFIKYDWHCIIDVWLFEQEVDINEVVFQEGETDDAMWATKDTILKLLAEHRFISTDRMPYINELP